MPVGNHSNRTLGQVDRRYSTVDHDSKTESYTVAKQDDALRGVHYQKLLYFVDAPSSGKFVVSHLREI